MVSYFQEEAALIDGGAQRSALFPGFGVGGRRVDDVFPGSLFMACYLKGKKKKKQKKKYIVKYIK